MHAMVVMVSWQSNQLDSSKCSNEQRGHGKVNFSTACYVHVHVLIVYIKYLICYLNYSLHLVSAPCELYAQLLT